MAEKSIYRQAADAVDTIERINRARDEALRKVSLAALDKARTVYEGLPEAVQLAVDALLARDTKDTEEMVLTPSERPPAS